MFNIVAHSVRIVLAPVDIQSLAFSLANFDVPSVSARACVVCRHTGLQPLAYSPWLTASGLQPEYNMDVEAAMVLCVRGGSRKKWVPVPTVMRGANSCVTLSSTKSSWAMHCLMSTIPDTDTQDVVLVLKAFEKNIRQQMHSVEPTTDSDSQTTASGEPASKRQRLLDSDDDSDSAAPSCDSQLSAGNSLLPAKTTVAPKASKVGVAAAGLMKVDLDGALVSIGVHKGPGLQISATTDAIQIVLSYIVKNYHTLLKTSRAIESERRSTIDSSPRDLLVTAKPHECRKSPDAKTGTDTNKIRWDFQRAAYAVIFKAADGSIHRHSKGLEVQRLDVFGSPLSASVYAEAKRLLILRARAMWNELDKSGEPRFEIPVLKSNVDESNLVD